MNHGAPGEEGGQKEYTETGQEKEHQNKIHSLKLQIQLIGVWSENTITGILVKK